MTTKRIADESAVGSDPTVDATDTDTRQEVETASRELLAKARYDAFRLMTEARDEAESILDEARAEAAGTITAARITAEATTAKAQSDAEATKTAATEEVATIVASAHRRTGEQSQTEDSVALEAEHRALSDRVSNLRTIADQLEDRFAALAKTAGSSPADADGTPPAAPASSPEPVLDYSPSVAKATRREEDQEIPAESEVVKESFYNRRSAKLPRLGDDGGRSALDMTRIFRESLDNE